VEMRIPSNLNKAVRHSVLSFKSLRMPQLLSTGNGSMLHVCLVQGLCSNCAP
jgi:hypothetical protein